MTHIARPTANVKLSLKYLTLLNDANGVLKMNKRKCKFNLSASPFYMQLIALAVARTQYQTHLTKSKHKT